jgi:hypothetical protein
MVISSAAVQLRRLPVQIDGGRMDVTFTFPRLIGLHLLSVLTLQPKAMGAEQSTQAAVEGQVPQQADEQGISSGGEPKALIVVGPSGKWGSR